MTRFFIAAIAALAACAPAVAQNWILTDVFDAPRHTGRTDLSDLNATYLGETGENYWTEEALVRHFRNAQLTGNSRLVRGPERLMRGIGTREHRDRPCAFSVYVNWFGPWMQAFFDNDPNGLMQNFVECAAASPSDVLSGPVASHEILQSLSFCLNPGLDRMKGFRFQVRETASDADDIFTPRTRPVEFERTRCRTWTPPSDCGFGAAAIGMTLYWRERRGSSEISAARLRCARILDLSRIREDNQPVRRPIRPGDLAAPGGSRPCPNGREECR